MYRLCKTVVLIGCLLATMMVSSQTPAHARTGEWETLGTVNDGVTSSCVVGSDIYIAGYFGSVGINSSKFIARYNTTTNQWSSVGGGVDSGSQISDLACTKSTVYAGGSLASIGGVAVKNVAAYDIASDT